jgi:hypothetical protein
VGGHRDPVKSGANWAVGGWPGYRSEPDATMESKRAQVAA